MDMQQFLESLGLAKKPEVYSIGNQDLNVNAFTHPNVGVNVNAAQNIPAGLLTESATKVSGMPMSKDLSLTNDSFRGGVTSQGGNTAPYAQYMNHGLMAKIMGGDNPNAMVNYMTPMADGRLSAGANYNAQGAGVNAQYEKILKDAALKDWMLRMGINANPIEQQAGISLSKSF